MLEIMGVDRAAQFKKKHLGFSDVTPKGLALAMMNNSEESQLNNSGVSGIYGEEGQNIQNQIFK
jgi:hypothetical protein